MKPIKTSSDGHAFLPLGQIEYEIFASENPLGLPVFRDPAAFSGQLKTLAAWHADQLDPSETKREKNATRPLPKPLTYCKKHCWV